MDCSLTHLAVAGYRSLQALTLPLGSLSLVCGANGAGKSNLYRSLALLAAAARGDLVGALAAEGGLPAVFWAGTQRSRDPVRLRLGFAGRSLSYAIELGYHAEDETSAFLLDPAIKREWIWAGGPFHPRSVLVHRERAVVERHDNGTQRLALEVSPHDSLFTAVADPLEAPEVFQLRNTILSWRFYDSFRTDRDAPARQSPLATRTPSLADAFPGCRLSVDTSNPRFRLTLQQPGLLRPLDATELSDGTLRYLLLTTALFSPRLPPLLVLNEPENSLHPDLIAPLARLIGSVSEQTQVWVIAHDDALIAGLQQWPGCRTLHLERDEGASVLVGQTVLDRAAWRWPAKG